MKDFELVLLGFNWQITHWEQTLPVPMLSGHEVCLQYFDANHISPPQLVLCLPFVADGSGKLQTCETHKIENPSSFDVRNLLRWLKVDRPDLQIKTDKL